MIDMFALLVSTGLTMFVVIQAIRLDRQRPWFERPKPPRATPAAPAAGNARRQPPRPGMRPETRPETRR